ncbi:MAG: NUDIX hydrolase [archaeon]
MLKISTPVDLIVINKRSQILLVKRSEEEGFKDMWSIPGGGPEDGENYEIALHREIKEELNCTIRKFSFFRSYSVKLSEAHLVRSIYFYGEIEGQIKINEEFSEFRWFDMNDSILSKLNFAFNQKQVVKDFISFFTRKKRIK